MLRHLDDPVPEDADPPELPERLAAKSLFRWEVCPFSLLGLPLGQTCLPFPMPFADCSFLCPSLLPFACWAFPFDHVFCTTGALYDSAACN